MHTSARAFWRTLTEQFHQKQSVHSSVQTLQRGFSRIYCHTTAPGYCHGGSHNSRYEDVGWDRMKIQLLDATPKSTVICPSHPKYDRWTSNNGSREDLTSENIYIATPFHQLCSWKKTPTQQPWTGYRRMINAYHRVQIGGKINLTDEMRNTANEDGLLMKMRSFIGWTRSSLI